MVQDLSNQGLTQLVNLRQKLGVSSVKCLVGVHWKKNERSAPLIRDETTVICLFCTVAVCVHVCAPLGME